jgi:hypothetical protein
MELSDTTALESPIDHVAARLRACRETLARGGRIELTALDRQINELCAQVVEQRPGSRSYLPRLRELAETLTGLEADLTRQFERR